MPCKDCAAHDAAVGVGEMQPDMAPSAPRPDGIGGPGGPTPGVRTRSFENTWDTAPSVQGPMGRMNVGYVSTTTSSEAQWARGELPDMGYGYQFALARPRFMREPRTNLGTYSFAKG